MRFVITTILIGIHIIAFSQCDDFQLSTTISEPAIDEFGNTTSLSGSGDCIAIGGGGGSVKVFQKEGDSWIPKGQDLVGELGFGLHLDLSEDGNILAIGNRSGPNYIGRVYEWSGCSWVQRGQALEDAEKIELSDDGSTIIIGNSEWSSFTGKAKILRFDGQNWIQIGNDIEGSGAGEMFGQSVDISGDGGVAVINDSGGNQTVRRYNILENSWAEEPQTFSGFGEDLRLSGDGNLLVAGNYVSGLSAFRWQDNAWSNSFNVSINYLSQGYFEFDLSNDGNRLAIGYSLFSPSTSSTILLELSENSFEQILELEASSCPCYGYGTGYPVSLSSNGNILGRGFHTAGRFVDIYDTPCGLPVFGCNDQMACNYDPNATEDDGSCEYPPYPYDCDLNCLNDADQNGICDEFEQAASFNPDANGDGVINLLDMLEIFPLYGQPFEVVPCIGGE